MLQNWDEIKRATKGHKSHAQAMDGVAKSLPSLMRADKIQSKGKKAGLSWDKTAAQAPGLASRLEREQTGVPDAEKTVGQLLFAVVAMARRLNVDAERALEKTCDEFVDRFCETEKSGAASDL